MRVAKTDKDPDGVQRDKFTCTANGSLGLCKLAGDSDPCTIASPALVCTVCPHTDCMHAPAVLSHLPPKLVGAYPADLPYVHGIQLHVARTLTARTEELYEEGGTDLAAIVAAEEVYSARRFEELMMQYHVARGEYLDALPEPQRTAAAAGLPLIDETQRAMLVGTTLSDGALSERVDEKLEADIPERIAEMQSLAPPPGGLKHLCSDSNVPIAKAVQLGGAYPNRKLHLTASAETRMIYGAALLPDEAFESRRAHLSDLVEQLGQVHAATHGSPTPNPHPHRPLSPPTPPHPLLTTDPWVPH